MAPGRGDRRRERTHHLTAAANINVHVGRELSRITTSNQDSDFLGAIGTTGALSSLQQD
jgi:hypothetical protein